MIAIQDFKSLTVTAIRDGLLSGRFTAVELADLALSLAESEGKEINCYITLCHDKARSQAADVDKKVESGAEPGILAGVPIAIKDNISYTGYLTSCASHILDGYVPPYDATVVTRLIDAGAVIIGKTNMDEFAMGSSNENSYYGPVKNPCNITCAPGGTSGGSAAAVAAGLVPVALGSDTGGSVRQPAAFCGTLGHKPTYGAVSRYGLVAFGSSLDQIGPLAHSADDLAALYQVIAAYDSHDSTSVETDQSNLRAGLFESAPMKIGVPKECFSQGVDDEIISAIKTLQEELTEAGHTFVDVSLPLLDAGVACYYIVATAEASSNLARYDGVRYGLRKTEGGDLISMYQQTRGEGFGPEVKRRILLGTYVLSAGYYDAYYLKGMKVREAIRQDLERVFNKVDLILTPTTPTPAFCLGDKIDDPLAMYLEDIFTVFANLAGIPGVSVPIGAVKSGLPIGAQFLAKHFDDRLLMNISAQIERMRS
ncbi:MAG: Asp-tRNA(Asn)/Glu-tRNA(Gln) amidotransferase subunit GatA [candidate division Zixibacteria bacterium]|nr:Asp-tRNA(Asn)/Glu-tRNA(Gln) amidotransferase subunit GatA [candidate division Zixibacteria bacterium]